MAEAVIVATSRTAIGRAGKGSLVDARPDDLSAFVIDDVLSKVPELPRDEVEDVLWGTAQPGGEQGYNLARVAGIQAAKRTSDMIPLCHPLMVGAVTVSFDLGEDHVAVEAFVDTVDRTGVEMEALHACSVAALTIYDMCKSGDRSMTIGELALWEKTGGRSGTYRRPDGSGESIEGSTGGL